MIAARWGLHSTFVASACFASVSMVVVLTNPETLHPVHWAPPPMDASCPLRRLPLVTSMPCTSRPCRLAQADRKQISLSELTARANPITNVW